MPLGRTVVSSNTLKIPKQKPGNKAAELNLSGIEAYLLCGALEPLSVGGVFVE